MAIDFVNSYSHRSWDKKAAASGGEAVDTLPAPGSGLQQPAGGEHSLPSGTGLQQALLEPGAGRNGVFTAGWLYPYAQIAHRRLVEQGDARSNYSQAGEQQAGDWGRVNNKPKNQQDDWGRNINQTRRGGGFRGDETRREEGRDSSRGWRDESRLQPGDPPVSSLETASPPYAPENASWPDPTSSAGTRGTPNTGGSTPPSSRVLPPPPLDWNYSNQGVGEEHLRNYSHPAVGGCSPPTGEQQAGDWGRMNNKPANGTPPVSSVDPRPSTYPPYAPPENGTAWSSTCSWRSTSSSGGTPNTGGTTPPANYSNQGDARNYSHQPSRLVPPAWRVWGRGCRKNASFWRRGKQQGSSREACGAPPAAPPDIRRPPQHNNRR